MQIGKFAIFSSPPPKKPPLDIDKQKIEETLVIVGKMEKPSRKEGRPPLGSVSLFTPFRDPGCFLFSPLSPSSCRLAAKTARRGREAPVLHLRLSLPSFANSLRSPWGLGKALSDAFSDDDGDAMSLGLPSSPVSWLAERETLLQREGGGKGEQKGARTIPGGDFGKCVFAQCNFGERDSRSPAFFYFPRFSRVT